jgi:hypothetical protein
MLYHCSNNRINKKAAGFLAAGIKQNTGLESLIVSSSVWTILSYSISTMYIVSQVKSIGLLPQCITLSLDRSNRPSWSLLYGS